MPKANDVKIEKETVVADPKTVETEAAAEEKAVDAAEKTVDVVEKKAEKAEKAARGPKRGAGKKNTAKKEKTEKVFIQCAGQEYELSVIVDKVKTATKSLRAVHEVNIYVKPEEGRAYYVAKKTKGEEVGSVEL